MRIFNADGGEVEACGNATRAVGLLQGAPRRIETLAGNWQRHAGSGGISVDMGQPRWNGTRSPSPMPWTR
jgi:diaminopimelate epimerase